MLCIIQDTTHMGASYLIMSYRKLSMGQFGDRVAILSGICANGGYLAGDAEDGELRDDFKVMRNLLESMRMLYNKNHRDANLRMELLMDHDA